MSDTPVIKTPEDKELLKRLAAYINERDVMDCAVLISYAIDKKYGQETDASKRVHSELGNRLIELTA